MRAYNKMYKFIFPIFLGSCALVPFSPITASKELIVVSNNPYTEPVNRNEYFYVNNMHGTFKVYGKLVVGFKISTPDDNGRAIAIGLVNNMYGNYYGYASRWQVTDNDNGAECLARAYDIRGLDYYLDINNPWHNGQESNEPYETVSKSSPLLVESTFRCDKRINHGDDITINMVLYVLESGMWVQAPYVFSNITAQ